MKKGLSAVLALLFLTGCAAPAEDAPSYRQIGMEEAIAMMETEQDYIIMDVRTSEEFREKHIPGAINIANETIGSEEIPELPDKDQLILVYCRSGNRSKQAAEKLVMLGYTNIVEFGGIIDWPGDVVTGDA
ncbi:MAG: rhodanese-like domain-containing protein [Oscillospiraceae bacterium]|nr:rhodanese-like domain-containing protein [Oscillospiraceae bacterium]